MLFFGDIHITSKHAAHIISNINESVNMMPDEKNIIFLGDYVYHFTYDRKALLQLFSCFIDLTKQWKNVYIVAWNHDWIADHFVFEEAKQTVQLVDNPRIFFITQPRETTIEWIDCLFLPFFKPSVTVFDHDYYPELKENPHPWVQTSRQINNILQWYIQNNIKKRLLIHHRYIANTPFPWQQAQFSYSSPALDPALLDNPMLTVISWHLHAPFGYKNYLCAGSVRHTSPLEINQQKFVFRLDEKTYEMTAIPMHYNPYLQINSPDEPLSKDSIINILKKNHQHALDNLSQWLWNVTSTLPIWENLQHTTITLLSSTHDQNLIANAIPELLRQELWPIKQKIQITNNESLFADLTTASLDLKNRFTDRKFLLRQFLQEKYGEQSSRYIILLEEEKIL
jgi:DNA repair exonuclease SbcCD nuclease subunit